LVLAVKVNYDRSKLVKRRDLISSREEFIFVIIFIKELDTVTQY
jgi:hypothetical protein